MLYMDRTIAVLFLDIMVMNIKVFGLRVYHRVSYKLEAAQIVTEDGGGHIIVNFQFLVQSSKISNVPRCFK
jgi:hypothetical protein